MTGDVPAGPPPRDGRDWTCPGCDTHFHGKPEHVTEDPFQAFCSDECYERVTEETYDWLTVMDGPEVDGRDRIWLGRETEPWEQLGDDGGTRLCAKPVQHIPLPWSMARSEIEAFLDQDDRGEDYLELFTLEDAD